MKRGILERTVNVAVVVVMALALAGASGCVPTVSAQTCSTCGGAGMAPKVTGEVAMEDGTQVLRVGVAGGYYSPNQFVVKAGAPVKVVFTGSAKGCLAKPTFKELGKKADFTTGEATIDLDVLEPGTYGFTCGMGMVGGSITAE